MGWGIKLDQVTLDWIGYINKIGIYQVRSDNIRIDDIRFI